MQKQSKQKKQPQGEQTVVQKWKSHHSLQHCNNINMDGRKKKKRDTSRLDGLKDGKG